MTRRHADTRTVDMFAVPMPAAPIPASMDYRAEVSHLIGDVLRNAEGDRFAIAAEMSRLTGNEVSKHMLDAWVSESRDAYNMPFYQAAVLETACHSHALTTWLVAKRGGQLLIGKESLNAELGKLERIKEDAARKIKDLKRMMGELE